MIPQTLAEGSASKQNTADFSGKGDLQRSSIRMKSVIPRFSKNTPEEAVVLKKKDTSALSSPWKVGKWRYEASVLKEAEFQNDPGLKNRENIKK